MLTGIIVFIGLVLLIVGHELGHFIAAKAFGIRVDEFGIGFPPRIKGWQYRETLYSINWLPFGGFVRIAGEDPTSDEAQQLPPKEQQRLFSARPAWQRSIVLLAGIAINLLIGWLLLATVLSIGTPQLVIVDGIAPNSPAAAAGFERGDVVRGYHDVDTLIRDIAASRGTPLTLHVQRDGRDLDLTATPRANPPEHEGALGVQLALAGADRIGIFAALREGALRTFEITRLTITGLGTVLWQLITHASVPSGVVGPVGIFSVAHQASGLGIAYFLQILAVISVNLAVLNMLPFPALDGGRFVLVLIERIRGTAVPKRIELAINAGGMLILLGLMLLVTVRDVVRLW